MNKHIIPLFFACDDNYIDYLLVTMASIREHANSQYLYTVRVLYDRLSLNSKKKIRAFCQENITIQFVNVSLRIMRLGNNLGIRDYYTRTTYFRLLLPTLFPKLDKVLYLDCDIVLLDDVAKLYLTDIGDNLVGAAPDHSICTYKEFGTYADRALDIPAGRYFNAGILIMNLKQMRDEDFERKTVNLMETISFLVAQDQDILNVMCKGRVHYLPFTWNAMPLGEEIIHPSLIHYNLIFKPWRINNVRWEDEFWKYAHLAGVETKIKNLKGIVTVEQEQKELDQMKGLKAACLEEANRAKYYRDCIAYAKESEGELCLLQPKLQNID